MCEATAGLHMAFASVDMVSDLPEVVLFSQILPLAGVSFRLQALARRGDKTKCTVSQSRHKIMAAMVGSQPRSEHRNEA